MNSIVLQFIKKIPFKNSKSFLIRSSNELDTVNLTRKNQSDVFKLIKTSLDRGRYGPVYQSCIFLLYKTDFKILNNYKFTDLLQPSGVNGRLDKYIDSIMNIIEFMKDCCKKYDRLIDFCVFIGLYERYRKERLSLKDRIRNYGIRTFIDAMSISNTIFLLPSVERKKAIEFAKDFKGLSKEAVCSGVSFIYVLSREIWGKQFESIINHKSKGSDCVREILRDATMLSLIREIEPQVFRLGYKIRINSDERFVVEYPDDDFGIFFNSGLIKNQLTHYSALHSLKDEGIMPLYDLIERFYKKFANEIFIIKEERGEKRIVMQFIKPFRMFFDQYLLVDHLYLEEFIEFKSACDEHVASIEDILNFELENGFAVRKFYIALRLMRFFSYVRRKKLAELFSSDYQTFKNSSLGWNTTVEFENNMKLMRFSREEIDIFLKFFSYDVIQNNGVVDFQYTPLVRFKEGFVVPYEILAEGNVLRNVFAVSRRRLDDSGMGDMMGKSLEQALAAIPGFIVRGCNYNNNEESGEIDILFFSQNTGTLFIFELKNTLLPTTAYERRTMHDYLTYASDQLDKARKHFGDEEFVNNFFKRSNWGVNFTDVKKIITGIVLNNRLMSGAFFNDHPIRHIWELINVIKTGKAVFGTSGNGELWKYSMWGCDEFSVQDLESYFSRSFTIFNEIRNSSSKKYRLLGVGKLEVAEAVFTYNYLDFLRRINAPRNVVEKVQSLAGNIGTSDDIE